MRPVVAIPGWQLADFRPRGITRVARAVAERLAARAEFDLVALTDPTWGERRPMAVRCQPLSDWLAANPMRHPQLPVPTRVFEWGAQFLPPVVHPLARWGMWNGGWLYRDVLRRVGAAGGRVRNRLRGIPVPPHAPQSARPAAPPAAPGRFAGRTTVGFEEIDVLLSFEPQDPLYRRDLRGSRCRVVSMVHDFIPLRINEGPMWVPNEFAGNLRLCLASSDHVVCNSSTTQRDMTTFAGPAAPPSAVVPLGHDRHRFARPAGPPAAAHQTPYFVFLGALEDRKNVCNILRAVPHLADAVGPRAFRIVFVGSSPTAHRYSFLIAKTRRYAEIELPGYLDDERTARLLGGSAALLYPSLWEGFGIPLLEAMSARVRVITSDISSMPEVAGEHAIYCDPYDPVSIARAMQAALQEPPEKRQAALDAAAGYAERFTWDATAAGFAEAVAGVCTSAERTAAVGAFGGTG
jgi:glycosyltransferase involved in cell wall biosynthesis